MKFFFLYYAEPSWLVYALCRLIAGVCFVLVVDELTEAHEVENKATYEALDG